MSRFYSRRRNASRTRRHHYHQELSSAAAVRKCQEQNRQARNEQAEPVSRPKPSRPTFEFRMAVERKAITEPDFPFPAFDADSMTDEQLCVYLFDLGGRVGSPTCDALRAWNIAIRERVNREWREQEEAKEAELTAS